MREQATRYGLVALIFALAGMYFYVMQPPFSGWLPPATPEELRAYGLLSHHNLAARAEVARPEDRSLCVDASANVHHGSADVAAAPPAYMPCDAPIATTPADCDVAF
jgi:hypothetical protein